MKKKFEFPEIDVLTWLAANKIMTDDSVGDLEDGDNDMGWG